MDADSVRSLLAACFPPGLLGALGAGDEVALCEETADVWQGTLEAHRTFAICPRPERENKDLGRLPTCATGPSPDAALLSSTLPHGASGLDALAHSAQTCQEPTYHAKPWIQGKCSSAKKCEVPSSPLKEERKTKSQNEQMASQYSPSCHLYLMKRKSYSPWQGTTASDQQPVRTRGMAPARVWSWKQSLPSVEAQPAPRLQLCERLSQNKMPRHS
nr:uncharacterized protein LOC105863362 isoform X3 [Microcebus murinus]